VTAVLPPWVTAVLPPWTPWTNNLIRDFLVNFVANLGGALLGVLLAFWLDRLRGRRESKRLSGRVLQGCRFELGYLRSSVQQNLKRLKAVKFPLADLSASLPATRGALVNPLVFEHVSKPLITALNAVSDATQANAKALEAFAYTQPTLARSDADAAAQHIGAQFRTALTESLTRWERVIGVAVESLDEEIRHLGLAAQVDPADYAMGQRLYTILMDPIEEVPPPKT
jgi:uncharacterized membrane protein YccC